jgi:hypothetical protein
VQRVQGQAPIGRGQLCAQPSQIVDGMVQVTGYWAVEKLTGARGLFISADKKTLQGAGVFWYI